MQTEQPLSPHIITLTSDRCRHPGIERKHEPSVGTIQAILGILLFAVVMFSPATVGCV